MPNTIKFFKLLIKYTSSWKLLTLQILTLLEKESLNWSHGFNNINTVKWWEISKNNGFKLSRHNKLKTKRKIVMATKKRKSITKSYETLQNNLKVSKNKY